MLAERLSNREVERLGDRLRVAQTPSLEDVELLQQLRHEYEHALIETQIRIASAVPGANPTSRLKTIQTIVEKLKRHPKMNLHRVQDIAGIRLVRDMSLTEQDELVAELESLFGGARVIDRRPVDKRSYGYRAVHVVARHDGRFVEIQVRTLLQDRWAQITEKLGDAWGRQIRYGEPPLEPASRVGPVTRQKVWEMVGKISEFLAWCEEDPAVGCGTARRALDGLASTLRQEGVSI